MLLLIPVVLCGILGAGIGYLFRFRVQWRRIATVGTALGIFLVLEITSGILSSKSSLGENLSEQLSLITPFVFLYLLPTIFGAFLVARRFRTWAQ